MPLAKGRPWMIAHRGTEFNSYHCVIEPLLAGARSDCSPEPTRRADVVRTSRAVEAVEYVDRHTGERCAVRCRAVVVAAGTVDSTALLLRSRSATSRPGSATLMTCSAATSTITLASGGSPTPSIRAGPVPPGLLVRAPYEQSAPLFATSLTIGLVGYRQRLLTFVAGSARTFGVQVFGTMVPTPDASLTLPSLDEGDPLAARPRITLAYDDKAVANLTAARQRLRDVLAAVVSA